MKCVIFGGRACGKMLLLAAAVAAAQPARAQTAEDIVQKQLGQLMIANANCSVTQATLAADLQKARAEIDDLKKQLAAAHPAAAPKSGLPPKPAPGDTVK